MKTERDERIIGLSGYLPYGTKMHIAPSLETGEEGVDNETLESMDLGYNVYNAYSVYPEKIKLYLRPMSSMTEEEKREYFDVTQVSNHCAAIDWLNEHKFDYRGWIEKDWALPAPEGMYC